VDYEKSVKLCNSKHKLWLGLNILLSREFVCNVVFTLSYKMIKLFVSVFYVNKYFNIAQKNHSYKIDNYFLLNNKSVFTLAFRKNI